MKNFISVATVASAVILSCAPSAHAAFIQNGTGLISPTSVITFDEIVLPYLTQVSTQYSSLGVAFSPFGFYFTSVPAGIDAISNFIPNGYGGDRFAMDVIFSNAVTEAAFQAIGPGDATATFTAYLGGNPVESNAAALVPLAQGVNYYGFEGITFDRISISPYAPSGDPFGAGWSSPLILDNIQRSTQSQVPAPMPLLGVGAALCYSRKLRKRIKTRNTHEVMSAIG
jgi:hypothetical protein